MRELVFFLEEESAKVLLQALLSRLVPEGSGIHTRFVVCVFRAMPISVPN